MYKYFKSSPDIYIELPRDMYHKMLAYAKVSKGEISGFGKTQVKKRRNGDIVVKILEIRIFKQVVTSAHTKLSKESLADFYYDLVKEGENPARWNLWWHSHHTFGVFFSGTDQATIEDLSKESRLYSICINKRGDLTGRYDAFGDEHDVQISIDSQLEPVLLETCQAEVTEKVTYETFQGDSGNFGFNAGSGYMGAENNRDLDEREMNFLHYGGD